MVGSQAAAAAFKHLRLAARLSQEELAERCHVSERTIRNLESGNAKRPHRDTLVAVAGALGLSTAATADFVASWRQDHRLMQEVLADRSPEGALRAEMSAQRRSIRELAVHQDVHLDAAGRWSRLTVRRTFEAVAPGVDRFPFLVSADPESTDPDLITAGGLENLAVIDEFALPDSGAKAFVGDLRRELTVGETCSIAYTVGYADAYRTSHRGPDDDEMLFATGGGLSVLAMMVHFDPATLPREVWRVRLRSVEQAAELVAPLTIGPFHTAQCAIAPVAPGVHGTRWVWDANPS